MLIVRVFGIPSSIEKGPLISLHRTIRKSVMCVAGGKGIAQDTKVFFPSDRLDQNWGEDLVCYVEGICNPSGKMGVIRSALASRVAKDLMEFAQTSIPYIKSVQVLVTRHEMDDGFCHIHVRGASKPKDSSSLEDRKVAPPEGHLFYSWMGHPQKVEKPD